MIFKFVLDTHDDSWIDFNSNSSSPSGSLRATHTLFIRDCWRPYGVLCFINEASKADLDAKVSELPPTLKKLWREALHPIRNSHRRDCEFLTTDLHSLSFNWDTVSSIEDIGDPFDETDLLVVGNSIRAENFGVRDQDGEYIKKIQCPSIEISPMSNVPLTEAYREAKLLSQQRIEAGQTVTDLWTERFSEMLKYSSEISLGDRYCLLEHNLRDIPLTLDSFKRHGLFRLMLEINNSDGPPKVLRIFTQRRTQRETEIQSTEEVLELINQFSSDLFQTGQLDIVEINEIPREVMAQEGHDRFLILSHTWCDIGRGIEILSQPDGDDRIKNGSSFSALNYNHDKKNVLNSMRPRTTRRFLLDGDGWRFP